MPQSPSKTDSSDLFHKFTGLNDLSDSVNRPKGAITDERNLIDDQTGDLSRRAGRDYDSSQTGSVSLIYQFEWDDGSVTTVTQAGSGARYDAFVQNKSGDVSNSFTNPATPGPIPTFPAYLPFVKAGSSVPDFTSLMRAISEAKQWVSGADFTWRKLAYAFDSYDEFGNKIGINIRTKSDALYNQSLGYKLRPTLAYGLLAPPSDGTQMPVDFYYVDYVSDRNYMVTDMNSCITNYNSALLSFVKTDPIDGATIISNYAVGDQYGVTATFATLQGTWNTLANLINNNLLRWQNTGLRTQDNSTYKRAATVGSASYAASRSCVKSKIDGSLGTGSYMGGTCVVFGTLGIYPPGVFVLQDAHGGTDVDAFSIIVSATGTSKANSTIDVYGNFQWNYGFPSHDLRWPLFLGPSPVANVYKKLASPSTAAYTFSQADVDADLLSFIDRYDGSFYAVGWDLADAVFISNRIQTKFASGTTPYISFPIVTPDETFLQQTSGVATTVETDIMWGESKLGSAGGASRSYPSGSVLGVPQPYTPSQFINFDSSAPGFNQARFLGPYRPTVLMSIAVGGTLASGSPTSLTVRVYINGTKVRTIVYGVGGGTSYHAFSMKGLGDFTSIRPPDNDPNNGLDGWPPPPAIRVTAQADTGSITLTSFTKLTDIVVNYPV